MADTRKDVLQTQFAALDAVPTPRPNKFEKEIRATPWFKDFTKTYKEEPNLTNSDYNYERAWELGVRPVINEYDKVTPWHWPSEAPNGEMLKAADHPTMWKTQFMNEFGYDPDSKKITKEQALQMSLSNKQLDQS